MDTIEGRGVMLQPSLVFEDPQFPDKVYKVEKALYGLHQAPRAWYETLSTYLLENGFRRGIIDKTLFIKKDKGDILLVQVMQRDDGIFISQDKYVADILKKFDFSLVKTASTLIETNKALLKDEEAEDDSPYWKWSFLSNSDLCRERVLKGNSTTEVVNFLQKWERKRIERAAITASSLEAEQDSGNINRTQSMATLNEPLPQGTGSGSGPRCQVTILGGAEAQTSQHNMVALLEKTNGSEGFHQIVDFLNASHIRFALSENPTIYDSHIKQFWQTATVNTLDNGEQEITATVDGHNLDTKEGFGATSEVTTADAELNTASTFEDETEIAKVQISKDAEVAQKLQEEFDASERQRMAQQMKILFSTLTRCEKCSEEEFTNEACRTVNQRKKCLGSQRAEAKRNKPMTPAQQKKYMSNYIKNQEGGYSIKQLKSLSFEQVKEIFETTMRKIREASGSGEESAEKEKELLEEELRKLLVIVPVEEVYVEALQIFAEMFKKFDRDDMVKLWDLVKERFSTIEPTDDKKKELWVEMERLFEPDNDDTLWKLQRYMHDPLVWRLYDTCGVHHVSSVRGYEIFMLVEKEYPLIRGLMTVMLANKLQVDQYSEMANELLRKIFILANKPRH
ncbi:ribonuclease H-like domain-containing protein [Tanacetum coccineum]